MSDDEKTRVMRILQANASKPFVQRILQPKDFPVLENDDGTISTHKMAWGEADGKFVVFPTILWDGTKLKDYGKEAFKEVMKTGNFIPFDTKEDAEWFSKRYKAAWDE